MSAEGHAEREVPETNHALPSAAASGSACPPLLPFDTRPPEAVQRVKRNAEQDDDHRPQDEVQTIGRRPRGVAESDCGPDHG